MLLGDQEESAASKRALLKEIHSQKERNAAWEEGDLKRARQEKTFIHFVLITFIFAEKLPQMSSLGPLGALKSPAPSLPRPFPLSNLFFFFFLFLKFIFFSFVSMVVY